MRPTGCFQTNHSKHKTSCNFVHWHAKNTWFLVQKSQIVSKNHDNVVSIVLYWTFLGLSAPYEVVERSCAFFCILIYFTRYKMYMCVGIGWSLNLLPFSNQLPSCDFRWLSFVLASLAVQYRFEGADDSVNPRFNLGFPDETFNMFVGCKNLSNTH